MDPIQPVTAGYDVLLVVVRVEGVVAAFALDGLRPAAIGYGIRAEAAVETVVATLHGIPAILALELIFAVAAFYSVRAAATADLLVPVAAIQGIGALGPPDELTLCAILGTALISLRSDPGSAAFA